MKYPFTDRIIEILTNHFDKDSEQIFQNSELLKYLNYKTKSANRGSKSRGSFGAIYSIYTLVEDYYLNNFHKRNDYNKYEGAIQNNLINRQRELPFGRKLQNHYFQNRTNSEYRKLLPLSEFDRIIIHDQQNSKYWINENLLKIKIGKHSYNIAEAVLEIINKYIETKRSAFDNFVETCEKLINIEKEQPNEIKLFILGLLEPNIDARIFEIVSYSILKSKYNEETVFFGFSEDTVEEENLKLFKTGRTNANDGGIDFVMKPLGRFFQVTETTDVKKYFLDIDKLEKFPITFVVKSIDSIDNILLKIKEGAEQQYSIETIVNKYIQSVEEIINLDKLKEAFEIVETKGKVNEVLNEILKQIKVEFNYDEDDDENSE
ncbi:MAG: restriction endonuclease [Bacteroidales bacterium]|nr:restriction endonuclease [Bacteroidales bacterium]